MSRKGSWTNRSTMTTCILMRDIIFIRLSFICLKEGAGMVMVLFFFVFSCCCVFVFLFFFSSPCYMKQTKEVLSFFFYLPPAYNINIIKGADINASWVMLGYLFCCLDFSSIYKTAPQPPAPQEPQTAHK